jgi:hypothetical protein
MTRRPVLPTPAEVRFVRRLRTSRRVAQRYLPRRYPLVRGPTLW